MPPAHYQRLLADWETDNLRQWPGNPNGFIWGEPGYICQDTLNGGIWVATAASLTSWVTVASALGPAGGVLAGSYPNPGFAAAAANLLLAGPVSGAAAAPTFRGLVPGDIAAAVAPSANARAPQGGLKLCPNTVIRQPANGVAVLPAAPGPYGFALRFSGIIEPFNYYSGDAAYSALGPLLSIASANTGDVRAGGSYILGLNYATGALWLRFFGATNSDYSDWVLASFLTLSPLGTAVEIEVSQSAGINPVIYVNGTDVTSQGAFTGAGSAPAWGTFPAGVYLIAGNMTYNGGQLLLRLFAYNYFNAALSAADVTSMIQAGDVTTRLAQGVITPFVNLVGSAAWGGSDGTVTPTYPVNTGADGPGVPPSDGWTKWVSTSSSPGNFYAYGTELTIINKAILFETDVYNPAGSGINYLTAYSEYVPIWERHPGRFGYQAIPQGQTTHIAIYLTTQTDLVGFEPCVAIGNDACPAHAVIYFKNQKISYVGALCSPDCAVGGGFQLPDKSGNALPALLDGNTFQTPAERHLNNQGGPFVVRGSTATNGNQQLGGGAVIPPNSRRVRISAKSAGTPTIKLGTTSGGGDIAAAIAIATANVWQDIPLASVMTGAGASSVWVNSTTTATVQLQIEWVPLSA